MNGLACVFFLIFLFFMFLMVNTTPSTKRSTPQNIKFRRAILIGAISGLILGFIVAPPTKQTIIGKHIIHQPTVIEGNVNTPATDKFILEIEVNGIIKEKEVDKTLYDKAENGMDLKELRK